MNQYIIIQTLQYGSVQRIPVSEHLQIEAQPNATYSVVDAQTGKAIEGGEEAAAWTSETVSGSSGLSSAAILGGISGVAAFSIGIASAKKDAPAVDTIPPTVTITSNLAALAIGDVATVTFTLSEASANFALADIVATGGTLANFAGTGTSYTADFTPTANSVVAATVDVAANTFTDAATNNNTVATQLSMTVDTIAPTVTITSNLAALAIGDVATVTFTLSEASANFALADIVAIGGTVGNFIAVSGTVYTADFTPTANSTVTAIVNVTANVFTDAAANSNSFSSMWAIPVNTVRPVDTSVVVFDLVNGVSSSHSNRVFDALVSYTIYINVDAYKSTLVVIPRGRGTWANWESGNNLGSDDTIILTTGRGAGATGMYGQYGGVVGKSSREIASYTGGQTNNGGLAEAILRTGKVYRMMNLATSIKRIWTGTAPVSLVKSNPNIKAGSNAYLAIPTGILTSQGLV